MNFHAAEVSKLNVCEAHVHVLMEGQDGYHLYQLTSKADYRLLQYNCQKEEINKLEIKLTLPLIPN